MAAGPAEDSDRSPALLLPRPPVSAMASPTAQRHRTRCSQHGHWGQGVSPVTLREGQTTRRAVGNHPSCSASAAAEPGERPAGGHLRLAPAMGVRSSQPRTPCSTRPDPRPPRARGLRLPPSPRCPGQSVPSDAETARPGCWLELHRHPGKRLHPRATGSAGSTPGTDPSPGRAAAPLTTRRLCRAETGGKYV